MAGTCQSQLSASLSHQSPTLGRHEATAQLTFAEGVKAEKGGRGKKAEGRDPWLEPLAHSNLPRPPGDTHETSVISTRTRVSLMFL